MARFLRNTQYDSWSLNASKAVDMIGLEKRLKRLHRLALQRLENHHLQRAGKEVSFGQRRLFHSTPRINKSEKKCQMNPGVQLGIWPNCKSFLLARCRRARVANSPFSFRSVSKVRHRPNIVEVWVLRCHPEGSVIIHQPR